MTDLELANLCRLCERDTSPLAKLTLMALVDFEETRVELTEAEAEVERLKGCGQRAYLSLAAASDELDGCAFQDPIRSAVGKHVDAAIANLKSMTEG